MVRHLAVVDVMRPGDIGLVRCPRGVFGHIVHTAVKLGLIPPLKYQHAFILARGCIIEAHVRVREAPIPIDGCDYVRPVDATDVDGEFAVWHARQCLGQWYGVGKLVMLAWNMVLDKVFRQMTAVAEMPICTELVVASAWRRAGIDILPGIPADEITPDMIARNGLVQGIG